MQARPVSASQQTTAFPNSAPRPGGTPRRPSPGPTQSAQSPISLRLLPGGVGAPTPGPDKNESERNAANSFLGSLSGDPMLARSSGAEDALRHVLRERGGGRSATEGRAMAIQQKGQQQQQQQQMMAMLGMLKQQKQVEQAMELARAEVPEPPSKSFGDWVGERYPNMVGKRVRREIVDQMRSQYAQEQAAQLEVFKAKLDRAQLLSQINSQLLSKLPDFGGSGGRGRSGDSFADTLNALVGSERQELERDKFNRPAVPTNLESGLAGSIHRGDEPKAARYQKANAKFKGTGNGKQPTTIEALYVQSIITHDKAMEEKSGKAMDRKKAVSPTKSLQDRIALIDKGIGVLTSRKKAIPEDPLLGGFVESGEDSTKNTDLANQLDEQAQSLQDKRDELMAEVESLSAKKQASSLGEMRESEAKKGANGAATKKGTKSDFGSVTGIKAAFKAGDITADQAELYLEHLQGK